MTAHLLACTLVALAALAACRALRRGPARWRYAILLAALLRFALPTAWLDAAGVSMAPMLPASARSPQAMEDLRRLLVHPGPLAPVPAAPLHSAGTSWLLLLWSSGAAACLLAWTRQLRQRPVSIRPAAPAESEALDHARHSLGLAQAVDLRIVDAQWVPGALGLWRPAVVLPEGLAAQLTAAELEAVLAHELAHVLRRDNLWAAAAHAVVAAFWFHPLVWWLERRLLGEREAACDELVLARGAAPETYLCGILKVCRMAFAGPSGYAGANGSNLASRMERIMSKLPRANRTQSAAAGVLLALATLFPLAGGYLKAQPQSLFEEGAKLLNDRKYDQAERAFRQEYELHPNDVRALFGLAEALMAEGRMDEAVALLAQESARRPERLDLQLAYGNIAVKAGKYDLAVSVFTRMLGTDSHSPEAGDVYLRLGETYRRMGKLPEAIAALRRAVELKPDALVAQSTLALTLEAAGQFADAQTAYRGVLQLDPQNGVARNNLAYLLASHGGSLDEALDLARDARLFFPQLPETADTLGYVYWVRQEAGKAFEAFRDALLGNPADRSFRDHMAEVLPKMEHPPSNAAALTEALRAEPTAANQELVKGLLK